MYKDEGCQSTKGQTLATTPTRCTSNWHSLDFRSWLHSRSLALNLRGVLPSSTSAPATFGFSPPLVLLGPVPLAARVVLPALVRTWLLFWPYILLLRSSVVSSEWELLLQQPNSWQRQLQGPQRRSEQDYLSLLCRYQHCLER